VANGFFHAPHAVCVVAPTARVAVAHSGPQKLTARGVDNVDDERVLGANPKRALGFSAYRCQRWSLTISGWGSVTSLELSTIRDTLIRVDHASQAREAQISSEQGSHT